MNTIQASSRGVAKTSVVERRLSVGELMLLIWTRKLLFASVCILVSSLIVAWAFLATPIYSVEVVAMPRQNGPGEGGLQQLLGSVGGLAGLAGLNISGSSHTQEYIAILNSRALFETLVNRENLMPVLFSKAWNPATDRWRSNLRHAPTMEDAWQRFDRGIRVVDQNDKTQLVTLKISWKNRYQAATWANELVRLANEEVRQRAIKEAKVSLISLQQQIEATDALELRQAIYRLMEEQIGQEVVAKSRPDYAFAVVDPATVPDADKFTSPRRMLLLLVALPFGLMIGSLSVVGLQMLSDFLAGVRQLMASRE